VKILEGEKTRKKGQRYIKCEHIPEGKAYGRVLGFVFCGASLFELLLETVLFLLHFCTELYKAGVVGGGLGRRMKWLLQAELVDYCPSPLRFSGFFSLFFCQNLSLIFLLELVFGDCHDISAWSFIQHEYFFCSLKDFSKKLYWNPE
jgi:hypothetical protein